MLPACRSAVTGHPGDLRIAAAVVQVADIAFSCQADHHPQAVPFRLVKQPCWRRRIDSYRIDVVVRHHFEIAANGSPRRELVTLGICPESAVGHPPNINFALSGKDELAPRLRPDIGLRY